MATTANSTSGRGSYRKTGKSVVDIMVEQLVDRIENEKVLPWQKPFISSCMNWYSEREYTGVNRVLLGGGEFITFKQLARYNEKHGTDFRVNGLKTSIVVYWDMKHKKITDEEAAKIIKRGFPSLVRPTDSGWERIYWFMKYYRVFNIADIKPDSKGNVLEPKLGSKFIEEHTPAEAIIERYTTNTGVKIIDSHDGEAWYRESMDAVGLPPRTAFHSQEALYRTIFHELVHSTGIKTRLNRKCFYEYRAGSKERGREEFVAEMGGLLLASEAGFREDTEWADNSLEYIRGWCQWMKDNKHEVYSGMMQAEKAKNFILAGGVKEDEAARNPNNIPTDGEQPEDLESTMVQ